MSMVMSPGRSALLGAALAVGVLTACNGGHLVPSAGWVPFELVAIGLWAFAGAVIFGNDDDGGMA